MYEFFCVPAKNYSYQPLYCGFYFWPRFGPECLTLVSSLSIIFHQVYIHMYSQRSRTSSHGSLGYAASSTVNMVNVCSSFSSHENIHGPQSCRHPMTPKHIIHPYTLSSQARVSVFKSHFILLDYKPSEGRRHTFSLYHVIRCLINQTKYLNIVNK